MTTDFLLFEVEVLWKKLYFLQNDVTSTKELCKKYNYEICVYIRFTHVFNVLYAVCRNLSCIAMYDTGLMTVMQKM